VRPYTQESIVLIFTTIVFYSFWRNTKISRYFAQSTRASFVFRAKDVFVNATRDDATSVRDARHAPRARIEMVTKGHWKETQYTSMKLDFYL